MIVKKSGGQVIGAHLTNAERKAMELEVGRQLAESTRKHALEIDALVLWFFKDKLRYGPKRLKWVFKTFAPMVDELCARYELADKDGAWLCTQKLKDYGVDLEQWEKERGD